MSGFEPSDAVMQTKAQIDMGQLGRAIDFSGRRGSA
jgi:hypothetical protein